MEDFSKRKKAEILAYTQELYDAYLRALAGIPPNAPRVEEPHRHPPVGRPTIQDIRPPQLNSYSGACDLAKVRDWLMEMEQYANFFSLNMLNGEAVDTVAMWLTGDAGTWWRSLKSLRATPRSWDAFTDAFRRQFVPVNSEEKIRQQLKDLKQTTSVQAYTTRFRQLILLHPPLSEADALFEYKKGLKPHIRVEVNVKKATTWEEAEDIALEMDTLHGYQKFGEPSTPNPPKPTQPNPPRQGNQGGGGNPQQPNRGNPRPGQPAQNPRGQPPAGHPQFQKLTPLERLYLQEHNGCFRCRELGHTTQNCPLYRPPAQPPNPAPRGENQQNHQRARQPARLNNAEAQTDNPPTNNQGFQIRY